ncbi:phage major capsid protein [Undibacterium sp. Di24W]|uniref:phage major capsid protein n=1 Tax=Undibacterium sp. Di24W TaxID=3413033 RepID=UPI003BF20B6C
MSIQALRERLAASNKAANHILAEKGSQLWTKEDQTTFDNHVAEGERCKAQIDAHEKMIAENRAENFTDANDHKIAENHKNGKKLTPAQAAFNVYLRKADREMTNEERQAVMNTMSTTTGSQGGFTVQSEIAASMIDYLKSYGYMRKTSSQLTTAQGNPLSFPTSDGTAETGEWIAQNTTATALDPSYGSVALNVFKASSKIVAVPYELLQDSQIDIQAMVFKRLADRIGRIANVGFTTGAGSTDPFGLITQCSVGKAGQTGQTLTITYDDLVDLIDSIDAAYLDIPATVPEMPGVAPGFMFSQAMRRVVRKIKDTAGRPIWTPSYDEGLTSKTPDTLLGYPVYINNDVAAPGVSAKSLAFGNLHRYMIRDAMDVTMFRFDDSAYAKLGQVGFLAWARMGGNLMDNQAVKVYQHSAT